MPTGGQRMGGPLQMYLNAALGMNYALQIPQVISIVQTLFVLNRMWYCGGLHLPVYHIVFATPTGGN